MRLGPALRAPGLDPGQPAARDEIFTASKPRPELAEGPPARAPPPRLERVRVRSRRWVGSAALRRTACAVPAPPRRPGPPSAVSRLEPRFAIRPASAYGWCLGVQTASRCSVIPACARPGGRLGRSSKLRFAPFSASSRPGSSPMRKSARNSARYIIARPNDNSGLQSAAPTRIVTRSRPAPAPANRQAASRALRFLSLVRMRSCFSGDRYSTNTLPSR